MASDDGITPVLDTPFRLGPFGDFRTPKSTAVSGGKATQIFAEVVAHDPTEQHRATQEFVEVVSHDPSSEHRTTQTFIEVPISLPEDIASITSSWQRGPYPIFRPMDVIKVRGRPNFEVFQSFPQNLSPGLLTNTNTFFAPTIFEEQFLDPGLLTNTQTFFPPTIILGQILEPDVLTNTPIFYPPILNGPATLEPHLYTSPNTFFPPTITVVQDLAPGLLTNHQTFFPPSLNPGLRPGLLINTQTFFPPSIVATTSGFFEPQLFIDSETFFYPCEISVEPEPRPGDDRVFQVGRVVNKGYAPLSLKLR